MAKKSKDTPKPVGSAKYSFLKSIRLGNSGNGQGKRSPIIGIAAKAVATLAVGIGASIAVKRSRPVSLENESQSAVDSPEVQSNPQAFPVSRDDIALRAYFIAERRRAAGLPSNPHQDWLDAECELLAQDNKETPSA